MGCEKIWEEAKNKGDKVQEYTEAGGISLSQQMTRFKYSQEKINKDKLLKKDNKFKRG